MVYNMYIIKLNRYIMTKAHRTTILITAAALILAFQGLWTAHVLSHFLNRDIDFLPCVVLSILLNVMTPEEYKYIPLLVMAMAQCIILL